MLRTLCIGILILAFSYSCKKESKQTIGGLEPIQRDSLKSVIDRLTQNEEKPVGILNSHVDRDSIPEGWGEIITRDTRIVLDLKYATDDNFTEQKIYDCPRCFLRPHVYEKLMAFSNHLYSNFELGMIIYDCYRPKPYQKKLWDIVPDPKYVTHPDKGSMHTRGMAVDLGLIDKEGNVLDMGTDFDHFGRKSFHSATDISKEAIRNRKLLKEEISAFGFKPITSEWWHYSYRENIYPLSEWVWDCN